MLIIANLTGKDPKSYAYDSEVSIVENSAERGMDNQLLLDFDAAPSDVAFFIDDFERAVRMRYVDPDTLEPKVITIGYI